MKLWNPHIQLLIALLIFARKQQLSFQIQNGMLIMFFLNFEFLLIPVYLEKSLLCASYCHSYSVA